MVEAAPAQLLQLLLLLLAQQGQNLAAAMDTGGAGDDGHGEAVAERGRQASTHMEGGGVGGAGGAGDAPPAPLSFSFTATNSHIKYAALYIHWQ